MNMVAEERACFVAYPAQPKSANGSKCWNWFNPGHQQRDRGEPSLIAGITRQISRDYAIDPRAHLCCWLVGGRGGRGDHGRNLSRHLRGGRCAFRSRVRCGQRPSFGVLRHAAGTSGAKPFTSFVRISRTRPACPDDCLSWRQRRDRASPKRRSCHRTVSVEPVLAELRSVTQRGHVPGGHTYSRTSHFDASGRVVLEMWVVHGAGHAWSGGSPAGSYTDPHGPDASREMVRFFLEHSHPAKQPI